MNRTKLSALNQHVEHTAQQLIISKKSRSENNFKDGSAGFLFTGSIEVTVPNLLLSDPNLDSIAIHGWIVLRQGVSDPAAPGFVLNRDDLAAQMRVSLPTASKTRTMLRAARWLTKCRSVRNAGAFCGDIFLLHSEPLSLQDTIEIDPSYIHFLEELQTKSSSSKALRLTASAVLEELEAMSTSDFKPRSVLQQMEARLSQSSIPNSHLNSPAPHAGGSRVKSFNTVRRPAASENIGLSGSTNNSNNLSEKIFNAAENNSLHSSCSSLENSLSKTTTTEQEKISRVDPEAEIKPSYLEQPAMMGLVRSNEDKALFDSVFQPWNRYASAIFTLISELPLKDQQAIINVILSQLIAKKVGIRSQTISNPVAYIRKLVKLLKRQELVIDQWARYLELVREEKLTFTDAVSNFSTSSHSQNTYQPDSLNAGTQSDGKHQTRRLVTEAVMDIRDTDW